MKPSPYSIHYDKLRAWMKQKREERGLSLRTLGDKLGRHHSVVGKMEQDRRKLELVEFVLYCEALEVDPHEGLEVLIRSLQAGSE